jgi:hypothetical protein
MSQKADLWVTFSRLGFIRGIHYLFWKAYFRCHFWVVFKVIWRIRPLAILTQKRNKKKALLWLRKTNGAASALRNQGADEVDCSPKAH